MRKGIAPLALDKAFIARGLMRYYAHRDGMSRKRELARRTKSRAGSVATPTRPRQIQGYRLAARKHKGIQHQALDAGFRRYERRMQSGFNPRRDRSPGSCLRV